MSTEASSRLIDLPGRVLAPLVVALPPVGLAAVALTVVAPGNAVTVSAAVMLVILAAIVIRRHPIRIGTSAVVACLGVTAVLTLVPIGDLPLTGLTGRLWVLASGVLVLGVLAAGGLLSAGKPRSLAAIVAVSLAFVVASVIVIQLMPVPAVDVRISLQQGIEAMFRGENIYRQHWAGVTPWQVQDAFTYLPGTAVLLAPGVLILGDVRWSLVLASLVSAGLTYGLALLGGSPRHRRIAALCAALLLAMPGALLQVRMGWTEPLVMAALVGWALAVTRGRQAVAVLALSLALFSKQHVLLVAIILAAWPRFGVRRSATSCALAGILTLPWIVASPVDFWHDTVSFLVHHPPAMHATSLYITAINAGWTPPFWLTGAIVLGTITAVAVVVRRRDPDLGEVLRWCALVLLVANLVNKQAFYNQYWLVAALIVTSWAVPPPRRRRPVTRPPRTDRPAAAAA